MNGYEATRAIRQLTGKAKSNIPIIGTYADALDLGSSGRPCGRRMKKAGEAYVTCSGFVKKIDRYAHTVMMTNQTIIPIAQISDSEGEMFGDMY